MIGNTFKKTVQSRSRVIILFGLLITFSQGETGCWNLARLKYEGGGDWYANPTSLPNLKERLASDLKAKICREDKAVELSDPNLFHYPILYMTGHGEVVFTDAERERLREFLFRGGLLWADDNYGLNTSFRRQMTEIFPSNSLEELPPQHPIFRAHYPMPGMPKVHEHDGQRPQLLGVSIEGRYAVVYSYESDLGDGWENPEVHNVPFATREAALKMGVNIVSWYLQGQPNE